MTQVAEKTALLYLTSGGGQLAEKLVHALPGAEAISCRGKLRQCMERCWQEFDHLVCIMATGIVVRMIGPLLEDKRLDPSVVVADEQGRFVISLLSGHIGGGNALASRVAAITGGQAVITTASDVLGHTALDLWAQGLSLSVADKSAFTRVMGRLVNSGEVTVFSVYPLPPLPADICRVEEGPADIVITCSTKNNFAGTVLHPKTLVAGIGCNRNTPAAEIEQALTEACASHSLALASVAGLASIDLKSDEVGLLAFAEQQHLPIDFFHRDQLNGVEGVSSSAAVLKATGAKGVAEPASVLAAGGGRLLVKKMKWKNVTVAIAEIENPWKEHILSENG